MLYVMAMSCLTTFFLRLKFDKLVMFFVLSSVGSLFIQSYDLLTLEHSFE